MPNPISSPGSPSLAAQASRRLERCGCPSLALHGQPVPIPRSNHPYTMTTNESRIRLRPWPVRRLRRARAVLSVPAIRRPRRAIPAGHRYEHATNARKHATYRFLITSVFSDRGRTTPWSFCVRKLAPRSFHISRPRRYSRRTNRTRCLLRRS